MNPAAKKATAESLEKVRKHLEYSFNKSTKIGLRPDLSEPELETLESFSSRFARYSDLIVSRYFRFMMLEKDPGYSGSVIDTLNSAEKFGWITSAEAWRRIRELRNVAAHEYAEEDHIALYAELLKLTPLLLGVQVTA